MRGCDGVLHKLLFQLLERQDFRFEIADLSQDSIKAKDHSSADHGLYFQSLLRTFQDYYVLFESVRDISIFLQELEAWIMVRILLKDRLMKRSIRSACRGSSVNKRKGGQRNCVLVRRVVVRAGEKGI